MRHRNRSYSRASVLDKRVCNERMSKLSDNDLYEVAFSRKTLPHSWVNNDGQLNVDNAVHEIGRRFRLKHQIGVKMFSTDEWQTIFAIEHPGIKLGMKYARS